MSVTDRDVYGLRDATSYDQTAADDLPTIRATPADSPNIAPPDACSAASWSPRPLVGDERDAVEAARCGVAVAEALALDVAGGPDQCRRAAITAALDEVSAALAAPDAPILALRRYQPGGLVAALGGRFDAAAVDRLCGRTAELRAHARRELVLECSQLRPSCGSRLPRVLARLRVQCLVDGARVELHHPPAQLVTELGQVRPQVYRVTDDALDVPGLADRLRGRPPTREGTEPS